MATVCIFEYLKLPFWSYLTAFSVSLYNLIDVGLYFTEIWRFDDIPSVIFENGKSLLCPLRTLFLRYLSKF